MRMINAMVTGAVLAFAASATVAADGNAAKGKEKTALCEGCHGIEDYRTAYPAVYHVPKLGGQHASYLAKALQAYKSGERSHPTMRAIAAGLTDQDMADLAAYYAASDVKTAGK
jgi:cytochrome c553